jgi:hypothetical protein
MFNIFAPLLPKDADVSSMVGVLPLPFKVAAAATAPPTTCCSAGAAAAGADGSAAGLH